MTLSKNVKIGVGVGTAWLIIYPLMFIFGWFFMASGMMFGSTNALFDDFPFSIFPFILPVHCVTAVVQLGLMGFYLFHIIKNTVGSDVLRVVLGIGVFFMPYLAMPFYYFIYIWPEQPPDWALQKKPSPAKGIESEFVLTNVSTKTVEQKKAAPDANRKLFIILGAVITSFLLLGALAVFFMYRSVTTLQENMLEEFFPEESPVIYDSLPLYAADTQPYYQPVELGAFTEISHFKDVSTWSDYNRTPIILTDDTIAIAGAFGPVQDTWRTNVDLLSADIETGYVNWQALVGSASLLSDSERIFVESPQRFGPASLMAYDAISGKMLWETQFEDMLSAAGVGRTWIQDSDLLVETTNHGPQAIYTLDRVTGEIKNVDTQPASFYGLDEEIRYGDLVLEKRGYGLPDGIVAHDGVGSVVWQFEGSVVSNIAVGGSITYFLTDAVKLVALDTETGEELGVLSLGPRFAHDFDFVNTSIIVAAHNDVVAVYFEDSRQLSLFRFQP